MKGYNYDIGDICEYTKVYLIGAANYLVFEITNFSYNSKLESVIEGKIIKDIAGNWPNDKIHIALPDFDLITKLDSRAISILFKDSI